MFAMNQKGEIFNAAFRSYFDREKAYVKIGTKLPQSLSGWTGDYTVCSPNDCTAWNTDMLKYILFDNNMQPLGVVSSWSITTHVANRHIYKANTEHPVFKELK